MDSRVDIRIAVVGEQNAGKETFSHMLFLENSPKIRLDPLSKLAEMYMEVDIDSPKNFKKIVEENAKHNSIFMQRLEISSIDKLRQDGIDPVIYKHTKKIHDLVSNDDNHMNKHIVLTFYFIGNNYQDFTEEISKSNIIIYMTDTQTSPMASQLFNYLLNIVGVPNNKKYLVPVVNKCDNLDTNGLPFPGTAELKIYNDLSQIINSISTNTNTKEYISQPILISSKYACIYRKVIHLGLNDLSSDDKIFISNTFVVKKNGIIRDIQKNSKKYLKRSGYHCFRNTLSNILTTNYQQMIDDNFDNDINFAKKLFSDGKSFMVNLPMLKTKAKQLKRIFKYNYSNDVINLVKDYLNYVDQNGNISMDMLEILESMFSKKEDVCILIFTIRNKVYTELISRFTEKLYNPNLTEDIFLPSKVHIMFDELYGEYLPKKEKSKLIDYISQLYSTNARKLLENEENFTLLYKSYFCREEYLKILSMFNEIERNVKFETYKACLTQMMLTKLMVAEKCICHNIESDTILTYCQSLKHYLYDQNCKKLEFLFNMLIDICSQMISKVATTSQLQYISENIDTLMNFKCDNIIDLDKFIIKRIKKNEYCSDNVDSDEDSDVEIYEENDNTEFTKDDMAVDDSDDDSEHEVYDFPDETDIETNDKPKKSKSKYENYEADEAKQASDSSNEERYEPKVKKTSRNKNRKVRLVDV